MFVTTSSVVFDSLNNHTLHFILINYFILRTLHFIIGIIVAVHNLVVLLRGTLVRDE